MKILFLINSLGGGGAEKVLVNMVNGMDEKKYDITIRTIFKGGENKKNVDKKVKLLESGWKPFRGCSLVFKILPAKTLYRIIVSDKNDYDLIVAYMHGAPTKILLGCPDKKITKIAWLHTDMRYSSIRRFFFSRKQIIRAFNSYDKIVGVCRSVSQSFKDIYGLGEKVITKYNVNDTEKILSMAEQPLSNGLSSKSCPALISIGRISKEKGYDRLLRVCKKLLNEGLKFKLFIIGRGIDKKKLEVFIEKNGLQKHVTLKGFVSNPYPYLKNADLFVCSSRNEGMSTAISEAVILGVPVITTRVSGAEEILGEKNEYGVIVENTEEDLYGGLKELLSNHAKLSFYKKKSAERAEFFNMEKNIHEIEKLFDETVKWKNS